MNHIEPDRTGPAPGPLIDRVQKTGTFASVRAALRHAGAGERVHVTGLRGSSFALLAEALRHAEKRPLVVVFPDEESAEDAFSDLRTISTGAPALFPERDIFPQRYERKENLAVRGDRNECLLRIVRGTTDIVVTSLLGFLEKTIAVESMTAHRRRIAVSDTLDLEEVRDQLVSLGYDLVPVVEEPGQFAVRGAIIDVFDPSWDYPARIELFDEDVESIRVFDLDTQRSIENVESVTLLPAASVPFEEGATDNLRGYLEARDFDAATIDHILQEITHSHSSWLWRRYAPALGMDGTLLDFFREPPLVLVSDGEACNRSWRRLVEDLEHAVEGAEAEYPLLGVDDYLNPPDYFAREGVRTLWRWELADVGSDDGVFAAPAEGERSIRFTTMAHPEVAAKLDPLIGRIRELRNKKRYDVHVYSETPTQRDRLADMLEEDEALVHLPVGWITSGFIWADASLAILTDHQIFGRILPRPRKRKAKRRIQGIRHESLQPGDFIVHVDYGIGRYIGLEKLGADGRSAECLVIRFGGDDRIFVPLEQMHLVEKYVGKEGVVPALDRLGGTRWQKTKERAKKAIEDIARDLLAVYAEREVAPGHAFPPDTHMQRELEASFPFEETPDQLRATDEVKQDMEQPRPMERLVCGDVGFGKTEVAIRAAFKAIADSRQVAVLVPTTLLAFQHYQTFRERMQQFPVRIEVLNRFVTPAQQKKTLEGLRDGTVDIVVGTHRLLSRDVKFGKLGLLIVDEEHRFGVKHKERLKQIATSVDVLALTATPIPRTMYMSLSGLRHISVIDTPPHGRHPVKSDVTPFDEDTIIRAITEEVSRDGQVFFVHNRVRSIHSMQAYLERLLPGIRFGVAHGQLAEHELERVMLAFVEKKFDVLISTMIIESGLDFPNVNTILINRADRFGLAQLYQLRGRVGRRERQAYAYFLVPRQLSLTETASRRLQAMEEFEELGSGYRLAMRDLEIRGAGNVLGVEQHGHVAAIGFDMYTRMLKEAVDELRAGKPVEVVQCKVESPYEYFIPTEYIADPDERMMIYKRLAGMSEADDVQAMSDELADRFGRLPRAVQNLLDLTSIKLHASVQGVTLVQIREPGYRPPRPEALEQAASVPERLSEAPRGVRRSRTASTRLARLARKLDSGELHRGPGREGGVTLEFGQGKAFSAEQCARLVETFGGRLLFKSGAQFGVTLAASDDSLLLADTRNLLQVAYFSTTMGVSPGH
jgi:transcription-repair coupling factor (superfamily II helicase)